MKYFLKFIWLVIIFLPIFVFSADNTNKLEQKSNSGEHVFSVGNMPSIKAFSFNTDGTEIWGTSLMNNKNGVFVIDSESGKKITNIDLAKNGGVEIVFSKDGAKAYVSQMETAKVFEIDAKTKNILRTFNTGGNWTKVIALSPDNKTLYATNWLSNDISVINLDTGKLIKKIKTVKTPRGIYITEDQNFMYVAGFDSGELQKINLISGEKKVIYKSGGALRHIVGDSINKVLYISDMAKALIYKLDLNTDKITKFATTDSHPNTIDLMYDGKILAVSCRGKNNPKSYYIPGPTWGSVQLFDTKDGMLLDAIIGGNQPTALATNGSKIIFSNFLDREVKAYQFPEYEKLVDNLKSNTWIKNYKKYLIK